MSSERLPLLPLVPLLACSWPPCFRKLRRRRSRRMRASAADDPTVSSSSSSSSPPGPRANSSATANCCNASGMRPLDSKALANTTWQRRTTSAWSLSRIESLASATRLQGSASASVSVAFASPAAALAASRAAQRVASSSTPKRLKPNAGHHALWVVAIRAAIVSTLSHAALCDAARNDATSSASAATSCEKSAHSGGNPDNSWTSAQPRKL
mmetsp:Transcript_102421/g.287104  ORF Transcript_102421/g.287104 Transcript_102421/m.287104 type:complete len:212 (+) Transcript_102421:482-1117(+)